MSSHGATGSGVTSRPERAAEHLAALARESGAGTRLGTKAELREQCGVAVGTFNEALRIAQARGVVAVRPGPGGGLFAAEPSALVRLGNSVLALDGAADSVADAVRVREALEPLVLADAAWHSAPADVAEYREQVEAMSRAADADEPRAFMAANWALHERLAAVNPSPMLRSIYLVLLGTIRDHTRDVLPAADRPPAEIVAERLRIHADLVEAIARRDEPALERLIAEHSADRS